MGDFSKLIIASLTKLSCADCHSQSISLSSGCLHSQNTQSKLTISGVCHEKILHMRDLDGLFSQPISSVVGETSFLKKTCSHGYMGRLIQGCFHGSISKVPSSCYSPQLLWCYFLTRMLQRGWTSVTAHTHLMDRHMLVPHFSGITLSGLWYGALLHVLRAHDWSQDFRD